MCNGVLADKLVPYEVVVQNYEAYEGHVWEQGSKWAEFVSPDMKIFRTLCLGRLSGTRNFRQIPGCARSCAPCAFGVPHNLLLRRKLRSTRTGRSPIPKDNAFRRKLYYSSPTFYRGGCKREPSGRYTVLSSKCWSLG